MRVDERLLSFIHAAENAMKAGGKVILAEFGFPGQAPQFQIKNKLDEKAAKDYPSFESKKTGQN